MDFALSKYYKFQVLYLINNMSICIKFLIFTILRSEKYFFYFRLFAVIQILKKDAVAYVHTKF